MGNFSDYVKQTSKQGGENAASATENKNSFSNYVESVTTKKNTESASAPTAALSGSTATKTIPTNVLSPVTVKTPETPSGSVSLGDAELIAKYESLPKYSVWETLFNGEKNKANKDAQEQRQALYTDYRAAKDRQTAAWVNELGIPMDLLGASISTGMSSGMASTAQKQLKNKYGLSDEQIEEAMDYAKSYYSATADKAIAEYATEHPVLMTAGRLAFTPAESMYNVANVVVNTANNDPTYKNASHFSDTVTETVANNIQQNAKTEWGGKAGSMVYSAGMAAGDEITAVMIQFLTGIPAPVLQGLEKSASVMNNAAERGLTPDQVILEGVISGVATTALTEKFGVGSLERTAEEILTKGITNATAREIGRVIGSQAASESLQEMEEDLADIVADTLIAGDKNEIALSFKNKIASGKDKTQAVAEVIFETCGEVLLDGIIGGILGGTMQGFNLGTNYLGTKLNGPEIETPAADIPKMENAEQAKTVNEEVQQANIPTVNETVEQQPITQPIVQPETQQNIPTEAPQAELNNEQLKTEINDASNKVFELEMALSDEELIVSEAKKRQKENNNGINTSLDEEIENIKQTYAKEINDAKSRIKELNAQLQASNTETVNAPTNEGPLVNSGAPVMDEALAQLETEREADIANNMPEIRQSEYSTKTLSDEYKATTDAINSIINMFGGEIGKAHKQNLYSLINEYEATRNPELLAEINSILETMEARMQHGSYTTKGGRNGKGKKRTYNYPTNMGTLTDNVNTILEQINGPSIEGAESEQQAVRNILNNVGDEATDAAYKTMLANIAEAQKAVEEGLKYEDAPEVFNRPFDDMDEILNTVPVESRADLVSFLGELYSNALKETQARVDAQTTAVDKSATIPYVGVEGESTNGTETERINTGTDSGNTERGKLATGRQSADRNIEARRVERTGNSEVSSRNLVSSDVADTMNQSGIADLGLRESTNKDAFVKQLDKAKKANDFGYMVDAQTVESLTENGARIFTDENGTAGFVIEKDGNIAAVHKNDNLNHTKRASRDMVLTARENGGTKMDCYGIKLARLYEQLGYTPVAVVDWNENYRPDDWPADKPGESIFVLMKDARTTKQVIEDLGNDIPQTVDLSTLTHFDENGYYDAKEYRDQLLAQQEAANIPTMDEGPRIMAEDVGLNGNTSDEEELPDGTLSITEDVPYLHKNADGSYVAQTAYNTVAHNLDENSEQGGKQFEKKLYDGSMVVQTITEPESRKRAVEALKKDYKGEKASLERMDSIGTGVDTDKSMIILDKELAKADETGDYTEVNRWARVIVDRMHNIAQAMQALAKYTRTAAGTVAKAERLRKDKTDNWSKQAINKSKVERAQKIAKALEYVIVGENLDTRSNGTKTHEQILEGVKNEFNDTLIVANEFTDEDMDFLATLIEQGTPTWIIANEIENKIETGAFFDTIEEASINQDFNKTRNQKLNNLIKSLKEEGVEIKERRKQSFEEIRKEVANTIENSKDFRNMSDEDIDYLARMVERGASSEYLTNELVAYKSNGNFGLSSEDIKQINELFKQMQDLNPESKEATKLWEQACAIAAKNLGNSSFAEKARAWRYMAMLLSSTTHERNIFGNGIFGSITDMKDNIAAGLEKVLAKSDPDMGRTKSVVSRIKDGDFLKAAGDYYAENAYASAVEDGSKFDAGDKIQREKRVFKSDKLEKLRKFSSDSLEIEDEMAIRRKYKRALVGYLKANGATVEIFTSDNAADVELLKKASDYALQQAKIATFHEKNKTAEVLSQWSTTANQGGTLGTKALALMLDSTLPFKKTPANVLKQGAIEYNPVVQVGKLIYQVATKQSNTAKADTAAKALTGSALLVLGILGRMTGVLKANYDDDDKFFGDQKFSINIGDFSYTIDWAAPGVLGVLSGAALYDAFEDGQIDGADLLDALASVGEPIVETSMLEGISNLIENIAYSVQGQGNAADKGVAVLGATASSMVSNYASQFIPTTVSKAARVIDPYRRTTYTKDTGVLGTFERVAKKTINSIPFVSMLNDPDIDEWGNEVRNSGFFNEMAGTDATILDRAIANFASPGYANNTARTEVEAELERLNGTEHEKNIIPSDPAKTYEGERLTQKQYIAMSRAKGQYTGDALETFFSSNCYNMLDDLSRTVVVNGLEGFCNALAKSEVLDYDIASNSTYKKAYAAYKESGMQGVVDYYATKQAVKSEAGSLTDYTKVIPALEKLDMTDAEKGQYIADSKSSLSKAAQTFANDGDYEAVYQYYMISINANSNKDNGLTQDELIDYLQKSDMSPKECEYWLKVFYPNISNDKIPIFK